MTDTSDKFDRLPADLEPTGAVQVTQDVCEWLPTLERSYLRANCSRDIIPRQWMADNWRHCPYCGRRLQIVKAAR